MKSQRQKQQNNLEKHCPIAVYFLKKIKTTKLIIQQKKKKKSCKFKLYVHYREFFFFLKYVCTYIIFIYIYRYRYEWKYGPLVGVLIGRGRDCARTTHSNSIGIVVLLSQGSILGEEMTTDNGFLKDSKSKVFPNSDN